MKTKTNAKRDAWTMIAVAAVAAMALTAPSTAFAKTVKISGTHTRQEIGASCRAGGGIAYNTEGTSGGYECHNPDKQTSVYCNDKGNCTGWVPNFGVRKQIYADPSQLLMNTAK